MFWKSGKLNLDQSTSQFIGIVVGKTAIMGKKHIFFKMHHKWAN